MKDFVGNDLLVGDVVAVTPKGYRGLVKATVNALTDKQVRLVYFDHCNYLVNYLTYPDSVIKLKEGI